MKKICIVIPAYNEQDRIKRTLEDYISFFDKQKKQKLLDYKIVVVLNGCKDNTFFVVEKFKRNGLEILEFKRSGKGFAITKGFEYAIKNNYDFIGFTDADGSTPPESFNDLINNINNFDGIIANRWHKKSFVQPKQTIFRRIISRVFNFIVRVLFLLPYQDTQCGAKLFKKQLLEKILPKLGNTEWSFDVDLLFYSRRENAKIKSIPTIWKDKTGSKINLKKTPLKMFLSILRLRVFHSPFKFLLKLHRKLPKKLQIENLIKIN